MMLIIGGGTIFKVGGGADFGSATKCCACVTQGGVSGGMCPPQKLELF